MKKIEKQIKKMREAKRLINKAIKLLDQTCSKAQFGEIVHAPYEIANEIIIIKQALKDLKQGEK